MDIEVSSLNLEDFFFGGATGDLVLIVFRSPLDLSCGRGEVICGCGRGVVIWGSSGFFSI